MSDSPGTSSGMLSSSLSTGDKLIVGAVLVGGAYLYYLTRTGKIADVVGGLVSGVSTGTTNYVHSEFTKIDKAVFPNRPRITCAKGIAILNAIFSANPISVFNGTVRKNYAADVWECSRTIMIPQMGYLINGVARDMRGVTEDANFLYATMPLTGPVPEGVKNGEVIYQFDKINYKIVKQSEYVKNNQLRAVIAAYLSLYGGGSTPVPPVPGTSGGTGPGTIEEDDISGTMKMDLKAFFNTAVRNINLRRDDELPYFTAQSPGTIYRPKYGRSVTLTYGGLIVDRPNLTTHKMKRFVYACKSLDEYQFIVNQLSGGSARTSPPVPP